VTHFRDFQRKEGGKPRRFQSKFREKEKKFPMAMLMTYGGGSTCPTKEGNDQTTPSCRQKKSKQIYEDYLSKRNDEKVKTNQKNP